MALRPFVSVPANPREWEIWCKAQFITADTVAPNTITTGMIVDANVTFAKFQNLNALSVFGRSVNSAGEGANISAANDAEVLRRNGASLGFGKVANAGLVNMADTTIKGRAVGAGLGDPTDLNATQAATVLAAGTFPSLTVAGNITLTTAGNKILIKEGANASMGTATLVAGTVTVNNTLVTANSRILLTAQNTGGTPGALRISARVAATSFTITSTSATDTSLVAWQILEPAP